MNRKWQLQEAKNKFSNLVEIAKNEGPQLITGALDISCQSDFLLVNY